MPDEPTEPLPGGANVSERRHRAAAVMAAVLASADEFKLDDQTVSTLNRLYWGAGDRDDRDLIQEFAAILSPAQLRSAISLFAVGTSVERESGRMPVQNVDEIVRSALDEKLKNTNVVEVEIAEKIAEKLVGWSKVFGIFVGVPIALALALLSVIGFSKFEDVRTAANRADQLLREATTRLTETNTKIVEVQRQADEITRGAILRSQEIERQLASLRDASSRFDAEIRNLDRSVRRIESQLGRLSAQYETGNRPAGYITATAPGPSGVATRSYGPWGMGERLAGQLVSMENFQWRSDFFERTPGSEEFNAAWSALGERESDAFREAQRAFIEARVFEPAVRTILAGCGLDVRTRSSALQNVVWAQAVSSGPRNVINACKSLGEVARSTLSPAEFDERLIMAIYQTAITGARHEGIRRGLENQRRDALRQLRDGLMSRDR